MKGAEMETEERAALAQSTYTPTYEAERQRFRAMRSYRRIVLLCILYGALFSYLLVAFLDIRRIKKIPLTDALKNVE